MWWLSTVVCHLISVTFKYFVAVWFLTTGLFMLHHLRAEFRISLKNVCRLFLKEWIIQGGLFGGCLGCLPCNSCQPSVERIASSPCSQFCLFVLWLWAKILGNILCKVPHSTERISHMLRRITLGLDSAELMSISANFLPTIFINCISEQENIFNI